MEIKKASEHGIKRNILNKVLPHFLRGYDPTNIKLPILPQSIVQSTQKQFSDNITNKLKEFIDYATKQFLDIRVNDVQNQLQHLKQFDEYKQFIELPIVKTLETQNPIISALLHEFFQAFTERKDSAIKIGRTNYFESIKIKHNTQDNSNTMNNNDNNNNNDNDINNNNNHKEWINYDSDVSVHSSASKRSKKSVRFDNNNYDNNNNNHNNNNNYYNNNNVYSNNNRNQHQKYGHFNKNPKFNNNNKHNNNYPYNNKYRKRDNYNNNNNKNHQNNNNNKTDHLNSEMSGHRHQESPRQINKKGQYPHKILTYSNPPTNIDIRTYPLLQQQNQSAQIQQPIQNQPIEELD